MATFSEEDSYIKKIHDISAIFFITLVTAFTIAVLFLANRLRKLRKKEVPLDETINHLLYYYVVFMFGYILHIIFDFAFDPNSLYMNKILDTWGSLAWGGVPIFCLAIFHY